MLAVILLSLLGFSSAEDRIHNGKEAEPDLKSVVYLGSLLQDPSQSIACTGTVISEHYILTAAHCVDSSPEYVVAFTPDVHRNLPHYNEMKMAPPFYQADHWIVHPDFKNFGPGADIALIKVETPMTISPVPLAANYSHPKDDWLRVAGYGHTKYQGNLTSSEFPKTLMETHLQGRSKDDCFNASVKIQLPGLHVICMYKRDSTILQGDSGGPAFAQGKDGKFYQVGVNVYILTPELFSFYSSWKLPLQSPSTIASFSTDVSYYCPWIEETTGGEVKCQTFKSTPIVP